AEPDLLLEYFESGRKGWVIGKGLKSEVSFAIGPVKGGTGKALGITYRLADWADVLHRYDAAEAPARMRDWTKHWGLRLSMYSPKPFQGVTIQVSDAGNELFVSNIGGTRGWNDIIIPFKSFNKCPYYQPPDAGQNGIFDLEGIRAIDFKPSVDGTTGTFHVDNVMLTNLRQAPARNVPA